jgi:hypothetical protein
MMQDFDPVVNESRSYGDTRYVEIDNIYPVDYCDHLYLYDPQYPPHEISHGEHSSRSLSLDFDMARKIRDRLNEILGDG